MTRACAAVGLTVIGVVLYWTIRRQYSRDQVRNKVARTLCAKSAVFLAGTVLWVALCVATLGELHKLPCLVLLAFLLVLAYLTMEVGSLQDYVGSLETLEGTPETFFERSTQVATVAFALGTLLVSQKDAKLARLLGPLVFLSLMFAVIPSLAVGQTVRRKMITNPEMGACQRLSVSFAAGLLCVALALSVEHLRAEGQQWL